MRYGVCWWKRSTESQVHLEIHESLEGWPWFEEVALHMQETFPHCKIYYISAAGKTDLEKHTEAPQVSRRKQKVRDIVGYASISACYS